VFNIARAFSVPETTLAGATKGCQAGPTVAALFLKGSVPNFVRLPEMIIDTKS
jgi:hypothetical protein